MGANSAAMSRGKKGVQFIGTFPEALLVPPVGKAYN